MGICNFMFMFVDPFCIGVCCLVYYVFVGPVLLVHMCVLWLYRTCGRWYLRKFPICRRNNIEFIHFRHHKRFALNWKGQYASGSFLCLFDDMFSLNMCVSPKSGFHVSLASSFLLDDFQLMQMETKNIYKKLSFIGSKFYFIPRMDHSSSFSVAETTFDDEQIRALYFSTTSTWKRLQHCYKFIFRLNINGTISFFLCNDKQMWPNIEKELCQVGEYYLSRYELLHNGT